MASDRQHQRGIASMNSPESVLGCAFHENRHIVPDGIAVEQPAGLCDHLLDSLTPEGGKPIRQTIDDLGDALIFLRLIHRASLGLAAPVVNPECSGDRCPLFTK